MSEWTKIRDNVVNEVKKIDITEDVKKKVNETLLNDVLPALDGVAEGFNKTLKEQAETETGWNRIRDTFVLPMSIDALLWFVHLVLEKTAKEAEK